MASHIHIDSDFGLDVSRGIAPRGETVLHKFGTNNSVSTSMVPITALGVYNTPQVANATTLRIKSGGNANDTANGSGARQITLIGLDSTGAEITETINTNGASASSATSNTFIRLYRAYVSASGTYATATAGSHAGTITIENGAGGTNWATLDTLGGFPVSQTRIAAYSVPLGKVAYIRDITIETDTSKTATVILFQRQNILQTAAPYSAMRMVANWYISGAGRIKDDTPFPIGPFPALTDIGFMGSYSAGTGAISAAFEILLTDA